MRIFACMPTYGAMDPSPAHALYMLATEHPGRVMYPPVTRGSLLANVFNVLWTQGLEARDHHGVTHFAMLHADVVPQLGWADKLLAECERLQADVVSCVLPIKDGRGVTSTAIDNPADPWRPLRRLTMREVARLPETFTAADAGHPGRRLLVNTGCWIADLRKPWADDAYFTIQDRRVIRNGKRDVETIPEDWNFSRQVQDAGGRVYATRAVHANHLGAAMYPNQGAWGAWERDEAYAP